MENNENNNLNELDQLKAQYETLKQQFDQQEIVNDRLMKSSIHSNVHFFRKYRLLVMIAYPILALLGFRLFAYLGYGWSFGLYFAVIMVLCLTVELWLTRNVRKTVFENADLLTLSKNIQKLKTGYAIYVVMTFLAASVFLASFYFQLMEANYIRSEDIYRFVWGFCITASLSFVVAILVYFIFVSHCNNVIRQIDVVEERLAPKRNLTFFYFVGAMAVLLGVGGWLVYVALRPTVYFHPENEWTSEGKLMFWEVYADTAVPINDAGIFVDFWQQNDSLVVMKGNEKRGKVKIYALKKTTPEGPAISAAMIGGKPLIERVAHGRFSKAYVEPTPIIVDLAPEAAQLWYDFTIRGTDRGAFDAALSMDGMVVQEWKVFSAIPNGSLFIMREWSSKEELEAFCEQLIRQ